jgi:hypothetical protein
MLTRYLEEKAKKIVEITVEIGTTTIITVATTIDEITVMAIAEIVEEQGRR